MIFIFTVDVIIIHYFYYKHIIKKSSNIGSLENISVINEQFYLNTSISHEAEEDEEEEETCCMSALQRRHNGMRK